MDALEFIRERNRMCKSFGDGEDCDETACHRVGVVQGGLRKLVALIRKYTAVYYIGGNDNG